MSPTSFEYVYPRGGGSGRPIARPSKTERKPGSAKFADQPSKVLLVASPARGAPRVPSEVAFLVNYGVSSAHLAIAAQSARAQCVSADRILLAEGYVSEAYFYRALARHLRIAFIDSDVAVRATADYPQLIEAGAVRLATPGAPVFLIAPRGAAIAQLIAAARRPVRLGNLALTTPTHLSRLVRMAAAGEIARAASLELHVRDAALCARDGMSRPQLLVLTAFASLVAFFTPLAPYYMGMIGAALAGVVFVALLWLRLSACVASLGGAPPRPRVLADADLPLYSIVVPLYREAKVVPQLLAAIDAISYPRAKLDVKFVIEEDDGETLAALMRGGPREFCEIILAPAGAPRTKPRALNVALPLLRGALVAVYDAEDIPDPQQLRLSAAHFAVAPAKLACLQARLSIDNIGDGWLAQLFAIEYAGLFDVLNVGLSALRIPFPLGGTSNHFRTDVLQSIGGWDAWNVTEDADIGLRLARFGYHAETLASTTYEEAPISIAAFFNQRRRWCKGWYQTLIVLWRHPLRLVGELGPAGCAAITLTLMANILGSLAAPLCAICLAVDAGLGAAALPADLPGAGFAALWTMVIAASVPAVLWPALLGMKRRGLLRLWPAFFLLPAYTALVCAAAWTAIFDLAWRPHYWHKTEHGRARRGQNSDAPRQPHSGIWLRVVKNF